MHIAPILGWMVAILLVIIGLIGTIMPGLPGTIIVFAGLLMGSWIDGFNHVGVMLLAILGLLSLVSYILEAVAAGVAVKVANASHQAMIGAAIGTVLGVFSGFEGLLFMPFIGAVIGEWIARHNLMQAGRAGVATWFGLLFGIAARLALAFTMIGIFLLAFLWKR